MPDLSDQIESMASDGIQSASVDGRTATAKPLGEVIEADQYLAAKVALSGVNANGGPRSGWSALRPGRVIPPGAV